MGVCKKTKKVCGVGINDADYATQGRDKITGKRWWCPYYSRWHSMIKRCYSEKYQEKNPTYKGCAVCEEWLYFSNFKRWVEEQDWKGKHLDKDFLVEGNKVYGPDTCVFMDGSLNTFTTLRAALRGDYPFRC